MEKKDSTNSYIETYLSNLRHSGNISSDMVRESRAISFLKLSRNSWTGAYAFCTHYYYLRNEYPFTFVS